MGGARARGVSLWLVPEGESRLRLASLIGHLAARLGTEPFVPHVTLLPGLAGREDAVLGRAAALASRLPPLLVRLQGIEGRDEPFRCLFARAAADGPLRAAHAVSAQAFGREPNPEFLPHLSLVYGTLAPEAKRSLAVELKPAVPGSLEAARLHVWRTEGPVGDWREIGAFPLGGGGRPY
jgi:2'-5' RNA ligase